MAEAFLAENLKNAREKGKESSDGCSLLVPGGLFVAAKWQSTSKPVQAPQFPCIIFA